MRKARKYSYYSIDGGVNREQGLPLINDGYGAKWNSRVSGRLQKLGVKNLVPFAEYRAPKLKYYVRPDDPLERLHIFQFEQINRPCHRCQKVKSGCFWSLIKGTEMRSVSGILGALARGAYCALCANNEELS